MRLDEIIQQHAKTLSPALQAEVFDFVLFLEQKQAANRTEPSDTGDTQANMSDFQKLLLESPEMTDEEYQAVVEKRKHLNQWT
ncbi:MAG: DUF2281 domain-containing protein [Methylovulum miyakonense]|uniref:DUF2281 domain-containing protein n=1 Tax=Methylovulum miyakonense TaxID=645578 RepID=UPI003BB7A62D